MDTMMEIKKNVKISVSQADVEEAVRDLIRKQDPTIVVDNITFTAKRSGPAAIGISVDAHFGVLNTPTVQETSEIIESITDVVYTDDHAEEEVVVEEAKTAATASASLFG